MMNLVCYILWAVLYILCAGLGFVPNPDGALEGLCTALSVCFFAPPALLLYRANRSGDLKTAAVIRVLSFASLLATLTMLILNFMSARWALWIGNVLYALLVILSSPMIASGYWALSLFLWACLLMASRNILKKT